MSGFQSNTSIKLLAEKLGLSKGTVSKALKDSHEISVATKAKVLAAAQELNYIPNHFASGLKSRKSRTVAVIVPEIVDSFFSLAIKGIEAVTQEKGYHINVYITNDLRSKEEEIIKVLSDGRVDGVLISVCRETTDNCHLKKLVDYGIPLVFFDRVADDIEAGKVVTDDFEGGYIAARHLVEQGCKKIYFLSISEGLSILRKRMDGFIRALHENNVEDPSKNVYQIPTDKTKSEEAIRILLSSPHHRPDGIVASVELLTIPMYNACKQLGIVMPDQLKIVCFSNLLYASLLSPSLSTITQPAFEIGQQAASLICNSIERDTFIKNERIICPSKLDVRESTSTAALSN
ncbi:LacI family DNA-binding transcriptional regulator [Mucilaginibacter ginsenosidivorans]|uniref:LacI family transcriptional regulator n=1 Tax=Mucilaginibacter ginsenosidivorans TaxID=398053 RepID=A0A5B8UWM2_9SPHI|nr:LacI family DNA-binding transcriptional regulator [Mucilaginibacter ginsenosidivorans]QEC63318.1 LacI family transcriptional regulator [Mucilaginibacter ginsenosidivorans]